MEPCHRDVMMKRFAGGNGEGLKGKRFDQPVTIIAGTTVSEIGEDGQVKLLDHRFNKSSLTVDNVVLASVVSDNSFYEELIRAGVTAIRIGDLKRPRNLLSAVREGAQAGLTLDEGLMLNANRVPISRLPVEVRLS
jgi:hypothetical protein